MASSTIAWAAKQLGDVNGLLSDVERAIKGERFREALADLELVSRRVETVTRGLYRAERERIAAARADAE